MTVQQTLRLCAMLLAMAPVLVKAQSPTDGLLMKKRELCNLLQYNQSNWSEYWQGTTKRSNSNLGTVTNQNVMLMSAYGITNKLNALVALPWVRTSSDVSYLQGQRGIQDLSLWLKWQPCQIKMGKNELRFQTTGGLSTPASNYFADFLPFSIGLKSKTASLRAIAHFTTGMGIYVTAQAGHTWRSNVHLNRDSYLYQNELIYSNEVPVPNWFDATVRLGILKPKFQIEFWGDRSTGLTGDDIRYNDGPMLTNKMQATSVGAWAKYWVIKQLAVSVGGSSVLNGRNVGQSTGWNAGIFYLVDFNKKASN